MNRRLWRVLGLASVLAFGCDNGGGDDGGTADGGMVDSGPPAETCTDGLMNQDESDVDCGGTCGATCTPGDTCADDGDCTTDDCGTDMTCQPLPTCTDGAMNGSETDVDCGGPMCMGCALGDDCGDDDDCDSGFCSASVCTAPVCGNSTIEGPEDCDDGTGGTPAETATCDIDCTSVMCGDGIVNATALEPCDGDGAGTGGETATCNTDCTVAACGDGLVNATAAEDCDGDGAGAGGETATCNTDCTTHSCGDGVPNVTAGEECDDGDIIDTNACSNSCERNVVSLIITTDADFDTTTGELDGIREAGWDPTTHILHVTNFTVSSGVTLTVTGDNAFYVMASGTVDVSGDIDARGHLGGDGDCFAPGGDGGLPGPGGGAGGAGGGTNVAMSAGAPGVGTGGGGAGGAGTSENDYGGGGGGGHLVAGRDATRSGTGTAGAGGAAYLAFATLGGGSGGGGGSASDWDPVGTLDGDDDGGGGGGGGGGAVRLEATGNLTVSGTIDASGGDGGWAYCGDGGDGGGGSGGTIVLGGATVGTSLGTLDVSGGLAGSYGAPGGAGADGEIFILGTCSDSMVNQDETDTDCGGSICGGCGDGDDCRVDGDCTSSACQESVCRIAACGNGSMDGGETDVDCGGPACGGCGLGDACTSGADCLGGLCNSSICDSTDFTDDFEAGAPFGAGWSTSGDALWTVSSTSPLNGSYSAQSGAIADSETTTLRLDVICDGPGAVAFSYGVSTEALFDYLEIDIDTAYEDSWDGSAAGSTSYPLTAGAHTIEWIYDRDFTGSGGTDTCRIDDVVLTNCHL
jgi:hypothetical protein